MTTKLRFLLLLTLATALIAGRAHLSTFAAQTAIGATASVDLSKLRVWPDKATVQLNVTGAPTTCTYQVEGSLDNASWFDVSGSQVCTSSLMFHLDAKPVAYVRGNLTALSGGTSPSVQMLFLGMGR